MTKYISFQDMAIRADKVIAITKIMYEHRPSIKIIATHGQYFLLPFVYPEDRDKFYNKTLSELEEI